MVERIVRFPSRPLARTFCVAGSSPAPPPGTQKVHVLRRPPPLPPNGHGNRQEARDSMVDINGLSGSLTGSLHLSRKGIPRARSAVY